MSISATNATFIVTLLISFVSLSYTANYQCLYELRRTQNVIFSLQNAVDSEDVSDLYFGMDSLMTSAAQINKVCDNIHLETLFDKTAAHKEKICENTFDEMTLIIVEFDSGTINIKAIQKLLTVFALYKNICLFGLE